MKILNFIPLLVWMLGFLALGIWESHLKATLGVENVQDAKSFSKMWLIGTLGWLIVGIALAIIGT
jgi:hypothetical protein